jgi:hypothetical protein
VDLVTRQRDLFPVIGGVVTLTTVRADGIDQRVLHRWPDKAGATSSASRRKELSC